MPGAIPTLNEAESKFFESRGQELAPALAEGTSAADTPTEEGDSEVTAAAPAQAESATPEKEIREAKFVPLEALQEERAEKKQLREELRQFREWQAAIAQRLKAMPVTPQAQTAPAPDAQTKPLEYINHVLGQVQSTTAELQQWRQQQEQAARQQAEVQQYAAWTQAQEQEFAKSVPEYGDAYRFAVDARDQELRALGYANPNVRAAIARQNTLEIIHNAAQLGRNPAELVWEYAKARGYQPKAAKPAGGEAEAQAKIAAGLQVAGAKLNQGGTAGEGELTAKDLAGITDPEEFEKAWKKLFSKRK